ncbi:MBL fold metallo-hydrolase [Streptomyces sp. LBUM 1478]|nr:MBL fold metallo-hydrolase [Streptomyces sp. LBUM 1478]
MDHFAEPLLRAAAEPTPACGSGPTEPWRTSSPGSAAAGHGGRRRDTIDLDGVRVEVYGELHAVVHPDLPRVTNVGFLVEDGDTTVFHPGDAFTVPGGRWTRCCCPYTARGPGRAKSSTTPARSSPANAVSIHDGGLSDSGNALADHMLRVCLQDIGADYQRVRPRPESSSRDDRIDTATEPARRVAGP